MSNKFIGIILMAFKIVGSVFALIASYWLGIAM